MGAPGGALRFDLLVGVNNLLIFDAVSVRAAICQPLSPDRGAGRAMWQPGAGGLLGSPGVRAGYANAQVGIYEFARGHAEQHSDEFLGEAVACLEDAIRQGHRSAIIASAPRAAFIEQNYQTAFFLYALLEESDPDLAAQRFIFADQLTQAEIDEAEAAAAWRAENVIKDYDDCFVVVNSPFWQAAPAP